MDRFQVRNTLVGKGLYFVHLNARSLSSNFDLIKCFISNNNIAACTISETWLNSKIPNKLIEIQGYNIIRLDRNQINNETNKYKRGGGLLTYLRNDLENYNIISNITTSDQNLESQWIEIKFQHQKNLIIANCYRPPNGSEDTALRTLNNNIEISLNISNSEIFIMGDFNIDLNKPSKFRKDFYDIINDNGLIQLIKKTTRQTAHTKSILDLIITNSSLIADSGVLYNNISDHFQVYVQYKHIKKTKIPTSFFGRNYQNENFDLLYNKLNTADWQTFDSQTNPNLMWDTMLDIIMGICNTLYPEKEYHINQTKEPWINDDIMHIIIEKDALLLQAKIENSENSWKIARQARNRTKNVITRAKSQYIYNSLNEVKNDHKTFWRKINNILPNKQQSKSKIHLKHNNVEINDQEIPDFINNFFTDIGPNLASKFHDSYSFQGPIGRPSFRFTELNPENVLKQLKQINISKSSAVNKLSTKILKIIFIHQHVRLTKIFNCCIRKSIFPEAWKVATVTPLKKEGFTNNVSDLRPISILPLPAKILEKLLHNQLLHHLENNKLLYEKQGGFRPGFSTNTVIANFIDDIYTSFNEHKINQSIFIDFSKAFDTIDHLILLKKLELHFIDTPAINLIRNYLHNRKQCVAANDKVSKFKKVTCGVPQGSVLGPLLFLIYINDMSLMFPDAKVYQYADDTVISISADTQQNASVQMDLELKNLEHWCNMNKLTINTKKTKIMYFCTTNKITQLTPDCNNFLYGTLLHKVDSYKYLGVILDTTLNFKLHVDTLLKTLRYKLYVFSKIRKYLTIHASLCIYKATILPYIDYGDIFYQACSKIYLQKIQDKQTKALKICFNLFGQQDEGQMHNNANLALLYKRRDSHTLNFMYKRQNIDSYLDKRDLPTRAHQYTKFLVPNYHLSQFKKSLLYNGAAMWNKLPNDLKQIETYAAFKDKTKLLSKQ